MRWRGVRRFLLPYPNSLETLGLLISWLYYPIYVHFDMLSCKNADAEHHCFEASAQSIFLCVEIGRIWQHDLLSTPPWVDPEGGGAGGQEPPEKSQNYRVS